MSTYVPIATQTLDSAAASVTFSSIPQNYTDLILVVKGSSSSFQNIKWQANGDTSSSYSYTRIYADGSSSGSDRDTSYGSIAIFGDSANLNTSVIAHFQNYSNNKTYKTVISQSADSSGYLGNYVSLWRNNNSITSLKLIGVNTSFISGTSFTIYGVAAGNSSAKATGGNIVVKDGSYWYHAFTTSGTFVPNEALSADILVVAGGGGGGAGHGGGGGAGGVLAFASESLLESTSYFCAIGAGGTGGTPRYSQRGYNGNDSQFASLTASIGGGGGGSYNNAAPSSGGSGGGGGGGPTLTSPASGTSGQGNNGGAGATNGTAGGGGGGGGKGSVGSQASGSNGGNGGAGTNSVTNWGALSSVLTSTGLGVSGYIAGGGGGGAWAATPGTGGSGGGGNGYGSGSLTGNYIYAGLPATANTGSGGGGGPDYNNGGGRGGSGLIIVRYAV